MSTSSSSMRRVITTRAAFAVFVGLPLFLLVAACSSRNGTDNVDVTGSVRSRPLTTSRTNALPAEPVLSAPATVAARRATSPHGCDYTAGHPQSARHFARRATARHKSRVVAKNAPVGIAMYRPHLNREDITGSIPKSSAPMGRWNSMRNVAARGAFTHVIAPNETLYSIARRYNTSVGEIARINGIDPNTTIRFGHTLIIPRT
jgi:hypothetical protein